MTFNHEDLLVLLTVHRPSSAAAAPSALRRRNGVWASHLCEYPMGYVPPGSAGKPEARHMGSEEKGQKMKQGNNQSKERGKKIREEGKRKEKETGKERSGSRVGEGAWRGVFCPAKEENIQQQCTGHLPCLHPQHCISMAGASRSFYC